MAQRNVETLMVLAAQTLHEICNEKRLALQFAEIAVVISLAAISDLEISIALLVTLIIAIFRFIASLDLNDLGPWLSFHFLFSTVANFDATIFRR